MCGEGPIWDERSNRLLWVDIPAGVVHSLDPASGRSEPAVVVGRAVGAAAPRATGGYVLAVREGFAVHDGVELLPVAAPLADLSDLRMNDGRCDRAGRYWAGSMADVAGRGEGSLFRLDAAGACDPVVGGVGLSNGLDWSPDSSTLYYVDTLTAGVDAFDFDLDDGVVSRRRRFIDIPPAEGAPDGLTVDADGWVWIALWGGACVRRYSPDGVLDAEVRLPVSQVTSCGFGGPSLDVLFVTSASGGLDDAARQREPHAGGLFCVNAGVSGQPTAAYAG